MGCIAKYKSSSFHPACSGNLQDFTKSEKLRSPWNVFECITRKRDVFQKRTNYPGENLLCTWDEKFSPRLWSNKGICMLYFLLDNFSIMWFYFQDVFRLGWKCKLSCLCFAHQHRWKVKFTTWISGVILWNQHICQQNIIHQITYFDVLYLVFVMCSCQKACQRPPSVEYTVFLRLRILEFSFRRKLPLLGFFYTLISPLSIFEFCLFHDNNAVFIVPEKTNLGGHNFTPKNKYISVFQTMYFLTFNKINSDSANLNNQF